MTAWVLIIALGYDYAFSVSGVRSQSACEKLGTQIIEAHRFRTAGADFKCFEYELK